MRITAGDNQIHSNMSNTISTVNFMQQQFARLVVLKNMTKVHIQLCFIFFVTKFRQKTAILLTTFFCNRTLYFKEVRKWSLIKMILHVYLPSMQNIWGVITKRLYWYVVGNDANGREHTSTVFGRGIAFYDSIVTWVNILSVFNTFRHWC